MKEILFLAAIYLIYVNFFGEESGCEKYASKFSCKYVIEKADFDVYYWKKVADGNPDDEQLIGRVKGLVECKNKAIQHSIFINEAWNDRAYICLLVRDGSNLEKHRLLN